MELIQLVIGGIATGCIYGLVALGFVLIYKATEGVNFAQGDMMMLGAFIALGLVNSEYGALPFVPGVILAAVIMGGVGYGVDRLVVRQIFGQPQFALVILTIAMGFVFRFVAGSIWGFTPLVLETPFAGNTLHIGGIIIGYEDLTTIIVTALLTLSLWAFFQFTKLGLAAQAASQNQMAAYIVGVPVHRVNSIIWALSGAVSTIAGVLYASKGAIDPNIGLLGMKAFAAAVIGGFGSLPGALLGGILIGVVEPVAARYLPGGFSQMSPYIIMLVVLVTRPNGLFAQIYAKKV
ncbi:amino acid/amide ABC transporter membrane protein 1, HAAT family [Thalassovita litoralis]|jgi:branched-chain amino acid transport system permease protein|uniref:Amino acid/amide ABC transporter membrane protein 1, HAAT family n=1 Tax=Thalassovita litoralis TaxID=1010611 RepID=A0A521EX86_9RHOB|nr:branched-chain amino acid ABC transporter permease [Thalassovita litoralis]SMO88548.1 amino acid/amide ABC transporter membrane protein 1, HAAT family [Thalassovita litoralis]